MREFTEGDPTMKCITCGWTGERSKGKDVGDNFTPVCPECERMLVAVQEE